jgi:hypothetical protein
MFYIYKENACLNTKVCPQCQNVHFMSYAVNRKTNERIFYSNSGNAEYFHLTNETICESKMLESLLADFVFQHVTFRGFCEAYNYKYANKHLERFKLIYKRVTEIFLAWRLAKYFCEEMRQTLTSNKMFTLIFH